MPGGNTALTFAIKAQNEASAALAAVRGDLERMEGAGDAAASGFDAATAAMGRTGKSTDDLGTKIDEISRKIQTESGAAFEYADAFGNMERVFIGVGDQLGVLEEQFGLPVGKARELTQAAADVTGGLEGIIGGTAGLVQRGPQIAASIGTMIPQIIAFTTATWASVTALAAQALAFAVSPWGLAIIGIAALIAAVILVIKYWDEITAKFPVLGTIAEGVKGALEGFASWITGTFVPAALGIYDAIAGPVGNVVSFVVSNWPLVQGPIEAFIGWITGSFVPTVANIGSAVISAVGAAASFVTATWSVIDGPIIAFVSWIVSSYISTVANIGSAIISAVQAGANFVSSTWSVIDGPIMAFAAWVLDTFISAIANIGSAIVNAVTTASNFVIATWDLVDGPIRGFASWIGTSFMPAVGEIGSAIVGAITTAYTFVEENIGRLTGPLEGLIGVLERIAGKARDAASAITSIPSPGGGGFNPAFVTPWTLPGAVAGWFGARGGFTDSRTILVGEEGPEILQAPVGSFVYNARQTANMLGIPGFANGGTVGGPSIGEPAFANLPNSLWAQASMSGTPYIVGNQMWYHGHGPFTIGPGYPTPAEWVEHVRKMDLWRDSGYHGVGPAIPGSPYQGVAGSPQWLESLGLTAFNPIIGGMADPRSMGNGMESSYVDASGITRSGYWFDGQFNQYTNQPFNNGNSTTGIWGGLMSYDDYARLEAERLKPPMWNAKSELRGKAGRTIQVNLSFPIPPAPIIDEQGLARGIRRMMPTLHSELNRLESRMASSAP